jgi:hypothetical protein
MLLLQLLPPLLAVRKICHRKNESSSHRYAWASCDSTVWYCVTINGFAGTTTKCNIRHTCWLWHEGQSWRSFPSQEDCWLTQSCSES